MKIYISAQAQAMRDVRSELVNHTAQIEENFVKLLIAPNATTRNHWEGEIASQINRVRKLTGSHKLPASKDIFKWIYTDQLPELRDMRYFKSMVASICDVENFEYPDDIKYLHDSVLELLEQYYKWLSEELIKRNGFVPRIVIFEKLDELL